MGVVKSKRKAASRAPAAPASPRQALLDDVRAFAQLAKKLGLAELEVRDGDFRVRLVTDVAPAAASSVGSSRAAARAAHGALTPGPEPALSAEADDAQVMYVTSPLLGTFYTSADPDVPPFVEIGQTVKPGDVLCIIEAMKIFNKIEAEVAGRILEVLVDNQQPVEYGTPLFKIAPI